MVVGKQKHYGKILVINSGSSSLKLQLFSIAADRVIKLHVDAIGKPFCSLITTGDSGKSAEPAYARDHVDAVMLAVKKLLSLGAVQELAEITAIGHRVVHGGDKYSKPCLVTQKVISDIKEFSELAPLHNPSNIAGILACTKIFPLARQYAVFDTGFYHSLPSHASTYALPKALCSRYKIRRYGFHGISHEFVSQHAARLLRKKKFRMITCHLGNGSSITAIKDGKAVDTSMGFTPLEGVIMGTRSGSIDPEIVTFLISRARYSAQSVKRILNEESGLKGISGISDMRELRKALLHGHKDALLATQMLAYRIAFFIGGYAAALGGLDCIVFTAGIGENAFYLRKMVCDYLSYLGVSLDSKKNSENRIEVSLKNSKVKIFVIPTDEEKAIAESVARLFAK